MAQSAGQERCPVYAVSVVGKQEYNVAIVLKMRAESTKIPIYSIIVPPASFGALFIEAESLPAVNRAIHGVKHVKGTMRGISNAEEVMKLLSPRKPEADVNVNDEVEILADVLRGSRARVTYVDRERGLVRVELLDSAFPIPLDLKLTEIKVIKKAK